GLAARRHGPPMIAYEARDDPRRGRLATRPGALDVRRQATIDASTESRRYVPRTCSPRTRRGRIARSAREHAYDTMRVCRLGRPDRRCGGAPGCRLRLPG